MLVMMAQHAATIDHRLGYVAATPGIGVDGTVATRTGRLGSVDATPRACAPGLHLVGQAVHVFTAQVGAGGSTTHTCRLGSVDATPGACAPGLRIGGQAVQAFAAKVDDDCKAAAITCRPGSVDATPGAYAPDLRSVWPDSALAAQVVDAGTATTQAGRQGYVNATPYAGAPALNPVRIAHFALDAQVGGDDTATAQVCCLGPVDAADNACTLGLQVVGLAVYAFDAQVCAASASSTYTCGSGSVDATPGASTPSLLMVGQAIQTLAAEVSDGRKTTTLTRVTGPADATPGACSSGLQHVSPADRALDALAAWQVEAGESTEASGFVAVKPDIPARALVCGVSVRRPVPDSLPGQQAEHSLVAPPHTAGNSASLVRVHSRAAHDVPQPTSDSDNGIVFAVAALNCYAHRLVLFPLLGTHMSGSTEPVTAYLQQINALVCAAGPLPVADEWAPIFWGLDQAWSRAHQQALTTQTFLSTLSTFMMVKGQIQPSSMEANYVRDIARSVAKVRLGMLLDKGPNYGLEQASKTQEQAEGARSAATSTEGTHAPQLAAAADLPPAERLAALDMAIANLAQAEQDGNHALNEAVAEAEVAQPSCSTDSFGGALGYRSSRVNCSGLLPTMFSKVTPLIGPGRLAALRTAARQTADRPAECGSEALNTNPLRLRRSAVIRALSLSLPCGHHCALDRARQGHLPVTYQQRSVPFRC